MCGIVAVVRRPSSRVPPPLSDLVAAAAEARHRLADLAEVGAGRLDTAGLLESLGTAAERLEAIDLALRGVPGVRALVADPAGLAALDAALAGLLDGSSGPIALLETHLDVDGAFPPGSLEPVNAAIVRVKDAVWAITRDRLRTSRAVHALSGGMRSAAALEGFTSVQVALSAIDRLEVRGRDSAGVHLLVRGHGLDLDAPDVAAELRRRSDPLFRSGTVRAPEGHLAFVYKAAAEIGELGDNVAVLRAAITSDELLHRALDNQQAQVTVIGHTRWASVGIISEANAHPLDQLELGSDTPVSYVTAVLNGDVDNHAELVAGHHLRFCPEITTDAKVIPALVARRLDGGDALAEAFRSTVAGFEGSVAVAAHAAGEPGRLLLALRGSGQALYVGLAEDAFVVASEPYGLVEETATYLRLDGETPANAQNPVASRGQVVVLDGARAGTVEGIERVAYDGTRLPVTSADLARAQITTRDVDRGEHPHFLLKELSEAPASFRKTLRGKVVERSGALAVELGREALPEELRARLRGGEIRRVVAIGQGTAAVAGQSFAAALSSAVPDGRVEVDALPATELSGFRLRADMHDTLVVAISQSGTTTDTNRTVDLVRARGGTVVAIVNRRNSDLVDRSDGVLYTSDGRDVEMSVASTKAFYSQVAAGFLLATALAAELDVGDPAARSSLLGALRELPAAMERVLASRPVIAEVAQRIAPSRRYWAVVGNGVNRIAAQEVRIKLSELCYKSIACDATEDKKHIDLSAEPMILVCAAGLGGSTADDVAKELAIYRAHKAAPVAIVDEGDGRLRGAPDTVTVPPGHPALAFVLSAMAGHVFGYEAALAIDASARPLREARAAIEEAARSRRDGSLDTLFEELAGRLEPLAQRFFDGLRAGGYDGTLEAGTAVRLASLLRYASGLIPLDAYQVEYGEVGTPATVVEELTAALTRAIEELTRPIDAIKHQAKTVTVGISRSDETLLEVPLVRAVLAAGAVRDGLPYRVLRTLVDLDPAVEEVVGYTRYRIEGDPELDDATIHVVDTGGIAAQLRSRTLDDPRLRGTKQIVAAEREVVIARGRSDGRIVTIVPEVKGTHTMGLTLLHVRMRDHLPPDVARAVLSGYRNRYQALRGAVTETEPDFDDAVLGTTPVVELLTTPVNVLADRWRHA